MQQRRVLRELGSGSLGSFIIVLLALSVTTQACGAPTQGSSLDPITRAEATSARRTAIAEVQRIIASNPSATPLPAATPTPSPSCPNAIWWTEARSHVGETRTVQGSVVGLRPATGGLALLEVGDPYPDPIGLVVIVPSAAAAALSGKTVCVPGQIRLAEGRPILRLADPASIVVVD